MKTPGELTGHKLTAASLAARQLCLYRGIKKDPVFRSFLSLVDELAFGNKSFRHLTESYFNLTGELATIDVPVNFKGDPWQYHLIMLVIRDDNAFTRAAEAAPFKDIKSILKQMAAFDLHALNTLARLDPKDFRDALKQILQVQNLSTPEKPLIDQWPGWDKDAAATAQSTGNDGKARESAALPPATPELVLADKFLISGDWGDLLPDLSAYHNENGAGLFSQYKAFRWSSTKDQGYLEGIDNPDPVTFDNLFGYPNEHKVLIENTERLLGGLPANNILLYGERGTGKSSAVKALVNKFSSVGLRLVEVPKQHLSSFPEIMRILKKRAKKFIIFVDDLSFEENEIEYKHLKAVLEGSLEARPQNILVYATSNRRHLIKERFSDRDHVYVQDEVRIRDSMQEKLSLADRFGITITFTSPDQKEYLNIVENLASQAGIRLPEDELRTLALQWEMRYNGRSGRTARQFVDWLSGEKTLRKF